MTFFVTNGTFGRGWASNRWDPSMTVELTGMRTIANNRTILADNGDHQLIGDQHATIKHDAMIYDLLYNGTINLSGTTQRFANTFTQFDLGTGNDLLDLTVDQERAAQLGITIANYTAAVTAIGGAGRDTLWTGYGNDTIYGDTLDTGFLSLINIDLFRGGFADQIHGGDGNDTIYGDYGSLSLVNITISGLFALGDDVIHGGNGDDVIYGDYGTAALASVGVDLFQFGDDTIYGGDGADIIYGDTAGLSLVGLSVGLLSFGSDTIYGGAGDDTIYGDPGTPGVGISLNVSLLSFATDEIHGGSGNDNIVGDSAGNLVGAASGGSDRLYGDEGNDTITGDFTGSLAGLVSSLTFGDDVIDGGTGDDILVGDYGSTLGITALNLLTFGDDTINGGNGNDTIYGDSSNTVLAAVGAGSDTINGGAGNDTLWGDFPVALNIGTLLGIGGPDVFVFGPGSGQDVIKDFQKHTVVLGTVTNPGVADTIDVSAYGITSMSGMTIGYSGGNASINLGGGNTITVEGPDVLSSFLNPLTAHDFMFA